MYKSISDFNNSQEIIKGFYDSLVNENCQSDPIRLPDVYGPIVHLTSSSDPENLNQYKNHTIYLNITCEVDEILKTKVKYWTAYIDERVIKQSQPIINTTLLESESIVDCITCFPSF